MSLAGLGISLRRKKREKMIPRAIRIAMILAFVNPNKVFNFKFFSRFLKNLFREDSIDV